MLFAICGTSGVGKTTILGLVLQYHKTLEHLVTFTTRPMRPEEREGVDYYFVPEDAQFQEMVQREEIVYPIQYRGYWYGTGRAALMACAHHTTLAILRPDKIPHLRQFTPLVGIFLKTSEPMAALSPDDEIILAHQDLCTCQIINRLGDPHAAALEILSIIQAHTGGGEL